VSAKTLADVAISFLENPSQVEDRGRAISLLIEYFGSETRLADLNADSLNDFLCRWCIERSRHSETDAAGRRVDSSRALIQAIPKTVLELLDFASRQVDPATASASREAVEYARINLPRSLEVSRLLAEAVSRDESGTEFRDFLTTFEAGGQSEYDVDDPSDSVVDDQPAALEGFFRVKKIEGTLVEMEEVIGEELVGLVFFPADVAALLQPEDVLELELIADGENWSIIACGFAYPSAAFLRS